MGRPAKLVAVLVGVLGMTASHAFYATLTPPPGWTAGTGPSAGPGGAYAAAQGAISGAKASANFTGKLTGVPLGLKYAPGAARYAARAMGLTPLGLGAAGIAWLAQECISYGGGSFKLTPGCGGQEEPSTDGYQWAAGRAPNTWLPSPVAACSNSLTIIAAAFAGSEQYKIVQGSPFIKTNSEGIPTGCGIERTNRGTVDLTYNDSLDRRPIQSCPVGTTQTPGGCVPAAPKTITPQEMEEIMAPKTLPSGVPAEIPGTALPIELPTINPSPTGQPTPLWIPQGAPTPVPNTDPQKYKQPGTRVTPAPTTDNPWRVDITPEDKVGTNPNGEPEAVPAGDRDPNQTPPEPGLCDQYPDILACQKLDLGSLTATPLKNQEVTLNLNPEKGFPTGGTCPQAKSVVLMGQTFAFSIQPICDFAIAIKPLLIGFAWLAAAMTFMGIARREN